MILKIRSTSELNESINQIPRKLYMKLSIKDGDTSYIIDPCIYNQSQHMFKMNIRGVNHISPQVYECIQALVNGINKMIS